MDSTFESKTKSENWLHFSNQNLDSLRTIPRDKIPIKNGYKFSSRNQSKLDPNPTTFFRRKTKTKIGSTLNRNSEQNSEQKSNAKLTSLFDSNFERFLESKLRAETQPKLDDIFRRKMTNKTRVNF